MKPQVRRSPSKADPGGLQHEALNSTDVSNAISQIDASQTQNRRPDTQKSVHVCVALFVLFVSALDTTQTLQTPHTPPFPQRICPSNSSFPLEFEESARNILIPCPPAFVNVADLLPGRESQHPGCCWSRAFASHGKTLSITYYSTLPICLVFHKWYTLHDCLPT